MSFKQIKDMDTGSPADGDWIPFQPAGGGAVKKVAKASLGGGGVSSDSYAARFYDNTGGSIALVDQTPVVVPINTTAVNNATGVYSLGSSQVTVAEAGIYFVSYSVGLEIDKFGSSGTARAYIKGRLQLDTGSGYADVEGTQNYDYLRCTHDTSVNSVGGVSGAGILSLSAGDKLRVLVNQETDASTGAQEADCELLAGSGLSVFAVRGVKGVKGDDGSVGDPSVIQLTTSDGTNVNTASPSAVAWNSQDITDDNYSHSTSVNNSRITVLSEGLYQITGHLATTSAVARANVGVRVRINGSTYLSGQGLSGYIRALNGHDEASSHITVFAELSEDDYIEIMASQQAETGSATLVSGLSLFSVLKVK